MILISSLPAHVWKTLHSVARTTGMIPDDPWEEWPSHVPWITPRGNQMIPNTLLGRSIAKMALAALAGLLKQDAREFPKFHREIPLPFGISISPLSPSEPVAWILWCGGIPIRFASPSHIIIDDPAIRTIRVVGISDIADEAAALVAVYQDREALRELSALAEEIAKRAAASAA